ncbi:hypothetical protein ACFQ0X_43800 [Streptomyces rectiviolaceus]|uniref:Uncharacterized protein n=1 Tax=Streptomyces rectiviolaceus TaxID=332591 RepID=A0ABP6MF50_9ACTN
MTFSSGPVIQLYALVFLCTALGYLSPSLQQSLGASVTIALPLYAFHQRPK